jgi:site-specific DNA recombinase
VVMARNYIENLREEVRKGMLEKAAQGIYPSRPPLGYRNNRLNRTIEVDPEKVPIVKRFFEIYAEGNVSLSELRKKVLGETGMKFAKGYLHKILKNPFYGGYFLWNGKTFKGTQELIVDPVIFQKVQHLFTNSNRSRCHKHDFAFSGLLTCAFDQCSVTAEVKKKKYIYYHCTGYKGKCGLPYVREEVLGEQLGQILENIHIPDDVLGQLQNDLQSDSQRARTEKGAPREKLTQRLAAIRRRINQAYADKLDGRISEEFWHRMNTEWSLEEEQILMALRALEQASPDRLLTANRTLELANKAHSLYLSQSPQEQGKLLRMVLSNCATDGVSLSPTYKKPFDLIFLRAKTKEWRARRDSNSRPIAPEAIALSS